MAYKALTDKQFKEVKERLKEKGKSKSEMRNIIDGLWKPAADRKTSEMSIFNENLKAGNY